MKLKVSQLYGAALAVEQMHIQCALPYSVVRKYQRIKHALRDEANNIRNEQTRLMQLHHGEIKDNGRIAFASHADLAAFEVAWKAFFDDGADLLLEPVDLSEYADHIVFDNADADLAALCNFVVIDKEGANDG